MIQKYIYPVFVKLVTLVEGDPKAPFSIATTPKCWGGRYSFPWIAPLYPWYLPYKARQHQVPFFEFLVWLNLKLKPSLPDHWWTLYSLGQWPSSNVSHAYAWNRLYLVAAKSKGWHRRWQFPRGVKLCKYYLVQVSVLSFKIKHFFLSKLIINSWN